MARPLAVTPGDVINTEVYVKYVDTNTANWTAALNTLIGQIAANTAGVALIQCNLFNRYYKAPYGDRLDSRIGFEYVLRKSRKQKAEGKKL